MSIFNILKKYDEYGFDKDSYNSGEYNRQGYDRDYYINKNLIYNDDYNNIYYSEKKLINHCTNSMVNKLIEFLVFSFIKH